MSHLLIPFDTLFKLSPQTDKDNQATEECEEALRHLHEPEEDSVRLYSNELDALFILGELTAPTQRMGAAAEMDDPALLPFAVGSVICSFLANAFTTKMNSPHPSAPRMSNKLTVSLILKPGQPNGRFVGMVGVQEGVEYTMPEASISLHSQLCARLKQYDACVVPAGHEEIANWTEYITSVRMLDAAPLPHVFVHYATPLSDDIDMCVNAFWLSEDIRKIIETEKIEKLNVFPTVDSENHQIHWLCWA